MKTIIMLCSYATPEFNIVNLKCEAAKWVLVLPVETYGLMPIATQGYFDEIIPLKELTLASVTHAIRPFLSSSEVILLPNKEDILLLAAQVRQELGLFGDQVDYVERFTDKTLMKKRLQSTSVDCAKYVDYSSNDFASLEDAIGFIEERLPNYPVFYKPCDGFGAMKSGLLLNQSELRQWLIDCDHQRYLIEEFLQGTMYHCDSVIFEGKTLIECVCEYAWPCDQFLSGRPIGSIILAPDNPVYNRIISVNAAVIEAMAPKNCATHMEIFHTPDDRLVFVEIAARAAGGRIVDLYRRQYTVDFAQMHLQCQLGIKPDVEIKCDSDYYAWAFLPVQAGVVDAFNIPKFSSYWNIDWYIKPGDVFDAEYLDSHTGALFVKENIAGLVVIHNPSYLELLADFNVIRHHQFVNYTEKG
ncbi:MAG: hypothetical protein CL816_05905 [Coxiellaceae bacterium]|nr:hypothetical protein [Coxiellaceae bacterium]